MTGLAGPAFERPPVSEVALAVYFSPPLGLRTVDVGALYERWRDRYPTTLDQPVLPPVPVETFDTPTLGMTFQLGTPTGSRVWFQTAGGERVIQVQPDRLVLNWRRTSPEEGYPSFSTLRPEFARVLADLEAVHDNLGLGPLAVGQAEVSYTNTIARQGLGQPSGEPLTVPDVLTPWSGVHTDAFLPLEEDVRLDLRYRIPGSGPASSGRLYVGMQPALSPAPGLPESVFLLQLFARGRPATPSTASGLDFLDLAHDWVVNGFVSLTTARMHKVWGQMTEENP